jgi:hypothetical protein
MKASLCLAVVAGLMAFGGLGPANAAVGGSVLHASRPALSVGTMVEQAGWHKKRYCHWRNHRRHCWWR